LHCKPGARLLRAMSELILRDLEPEDVDWIVERHGALYARDEGFDDSFAPLVAQILADYAATRESERERAWIATRNGVRLGCVFCVRGPDDETAKLRLFLVVPEARGLGLGRRLVETCMGWARARGYRRMTLWTYESHRAVCALYERTGWKIRSSEARRSFGVDVVEQIWDVAL
jgi:GNAT superfamily N-acetyltransferase